MVAESKTKPTSAPSFYTEDHSVLSILDMPQLCLLCAFLRGLCGKNAASFAFLLCVLCGKKMKNYLIRNPPSTTSTKPVAALLPW